MIACVVASAIESSSRVLLVLSEAADKQQGLLNCQTALSHARCHRTLNQGATIQKEEGS